MKKTFTRILALVLSLSLALCLGACGGSDENWNTIPPLPNPYEEDTTTEATTPVTTQPEINTVGDGNVSYVMIYNPNIYEENATRNNVRSTGSFGQQVDTSMAKADGLEMPSDYPFKNWEQEDIDPDIPLEQLNLDGNRADIMITPYKAGDRKTFYCFNTAMGRTTQEFTCFYAGQYCNVWSCDPQFGAVAAEVYGQEFDGKIYPAMLQSFGTARFADNGGKVNLLFYQMADGLAGCFTNADLFASAEASAEMISLYGMNTDHAILSINSKYAIYQNYVELMSSTMAHEFQHLICATDSIYAMNGQYCNTWLNEAMSGYVEEMLYPGAKSLSGHYTAFATSDRIRNGQSLYNFENDSNDIGVYGSVYLFSEYLAQLASQDTTYRQFHDGWRNSYSTTICDAEGMHKTVPQSAISKIDGMVEFGNSITFNTEQEEWMSKLALGFYMSLLEKDASAPEAYRNVDPQTLLYNQINAASIEGGGRIIFAVKGGSFEIPQDADAGLVYVGLDANFQPVTDFIVK